MATDASVPIRRGNGRPFSRLSRSRVRLKETEFDAIYRAFYVCLVRRVSWRYGLSKDDAREIVHDAFLLALARMDPTGNPRAWLYGVVDRLALNWRRKQERRARLMSVFGPSEMPWKSLGRTEEEI